MIEHICDRKELGTDKEYLYGEAVTEIIYHIQDKVWLASNNEYGTIIKYCPFCGVLLSTPIAEGV
jgi:hypothetical protein